MMTKPYGSWPSGISTFIPKKLAIIVGMARMIVMDVRNFSTLFRLFEII